MAVPSAAIKWHAAQGVGVRFSLTPLNRAPSVVVTGSLSNAKECPQSASASSDPIRSSAGSGRRERTTPHLPSLFGQQQSSETERGDRRKKRDGMVKESNLAP